MPNLSATDRQELINLLEAGEEIPADYKHLLFPPERQEYELVYGGKEREEEVLAETMGVPLQAIRSFEGKDSTWHNLLISGDNVQTMKTLLKMKKEGRLVNPDGTYGIKLAYIDPPFAAKQFFQSVPEERAYQDKIAGAKFLEMLRKGLIFIRELLADNGSLFVHLDYRKVHYIKILLDELFGEQNFRNEIILPGRAAKNLQQQFNSISRLNVRHDTLLWYSKSASTRFNPLWAEKHNPGNPEGHWHHFWSTADRPTMRYELFGITPETGQWTWKEKRALQAVSNYERFLRESGERTLVEYWRDTGGKLEFIRRDSIDGKPQYWRSPTEVQLADTMWAGIPVYSNSTGYPTEKNEALLRQIIQMASSDDDIILDAFAGSGTTLITAEKLKRRWIGIDSGKVAIYTIQKRMLNLTKDKGRKSKRLEPKPFTLYNSGHYDFSRLRELPWEGWRAYALGLFQCRDEPHKIKGIPLDGYRDGDDVLIFNHRAHGGVMLDYGFIENLHSDIGSRISSRFFIIAPAASVAFLEDYVDLGNTRYYILRIPYSIINELHRRDFTTATQAIDKAQINELVQSIGFDFSRQPKVECQYSRGKRKGEMFEDAVVTVKTFRSEAMLQGISTKENRETLSMVLVDYNYPFDPNRKSEDPLPPFQLDAVFYAKAIAAANWEVRMQLDTLGDYIMLIYVDIYGNEYTEVKSIADFEVIEP